MVEVHIMSGGISFASGSAASLSGVNVVTTVNTTTNISGQNVVVSSGAISVVSGSVTVNSGTVSVSGLYQGGLAIQSGAGGVSGMLPIALMAYDFSGANWGPVAGVVSGGAGIGVRSFAPTKILFIISGVGTTTTNGITSSSGGSVLSSGACISITVKNNSGNNTMYIGSATTPPVSGFGFQLGGGDALTLAVNNFNQVAVQAATSGQQISYIGVAY